MIAPASPAYTLPAAPPTAPAAHPTSAPPQPGAGGPVHVRLLAINDLHGQLPDSDAKLGTKELGGGATLATYIKRARAENPAGTVLVSSGDAIGASPPESTLLDHESTIATMAALGVDLATFGNHEFDRGYRELIRLVLGGKRRKAVSAAAQKARAAQAPGTGSHWPGSPFPWLSANVVDAKSGKPIMPPYAIMQVNGVKVAFIGAVTKNLKQVTAPDGIRNLKALDPATAINRYIPEIKKQGVRTIVAFVHEGAERDARTGKLSGPLVPLVRALDKEVDVVMSAHTHQEYATRIDGRIVTQGSSYAKAFSQVDLQVDPKTGDVIAGAGKVVHNLEQGAAPDPEVAAAVRVFEQLVAPTTQRVISKLPAPITREASAAGETALGVLIAEAQRRKAGADIALMNPGGIRQDIAAGGAITWGKLFAVQPFANRVVKLRMSGAQLRTVLEQMFRPPGENPIVLQVAGLRVTFDMRRPLGKRVVSVVTSDGRPVDPARSYTVAVNSFLADGGDGFTSLKQARRVSSHGDDIEALVAYLKSGAPVPIKPIGNLRLAGGELPTHKH